jgi:predicted metalloprotease with PDZ domain
VNAEPMEMPVAYRVRVIPEQHELAVEMTIRGERPAGPLRLELPTWVPGDYSYFPFGRDLFDLRAVDAKGKSLAVSRDGWQAFEVADAKGPITVSYRAYAYGNDLSEPAGLLDSDFGVILGARYLHSPALLRPCRVTYELPKGWKVHHPSGATRVGKSTAWDYPSFETLLDTPVVMGTFDLRVRKVKGTTIYYAFVDRAIGYDSEVDRFVDDVTKTVLQFHEMFGSFPFDDYTFVLSMNPANDWGLEHLTSTMCGLGPTVFIDPVAYAVGIRVCAHELFHAWNVRRLRPAMLGKLDFYTGTFTDGLWVAEGFTRYYEFLTCTRTGAYTPDQFFSSVVNYKTHLAGTPAYRRVTAADSSLATYLNHQKYPGRCNNAIDYYDKGMLIAFELDVQLRLNGDSLDQAFSAFYKKYVGVGAGYAIAEIVAFFEARLPGLGALLSGAALQPAHLDVEGKLEKLGFRLEVTPGFYVGLMFGDTTSPAIYGVLDDAPAGLAGLAPDDVLQRVNGYPYSFQALQWAAGRSDALTLDVLRGHRTITAKINPEQRPTISNLVWHGDPPQAGLIRAWLQSPFDPQKNQVFPLDYYDNFHGIETVV